MHDEKEIYVRYRLLGNSGLRVSEAALGAMTFGEDWGWGTAKDEARKVYDAFREAGGNFIDTANVYTNGTSESFLGEFMQGHRQSVVLANKYTNAAPGTDPNAAGNHRKSMMQAVEASLKRLQTDYIDLYWVHIWDRMTPVEEVMRGLDLRRAIAPPVSSHADCTRPRPPIPSPSNKSPRRARRRMPGLHKRQPGCRTHNAPDRP